MAYTPFRTVHHSNETVIPGGMKVFLCANGGTVGMFQEEQHVPASIVLRLLLRYGDRIVNAFEVGCLKMRPEYWPACQQLVGFDPARSLYIDDDEGCLRAAHGFGVAYLYHRSKSSSQLAPEPSATFHSIEHFSTLTDI